MAGSSAGWHCPAHVHVRERGVREHRTLSRSCWMTPRQVKGVKIFRQPSSSNPLSKRASPPYDNASTLPYVLHPGGRCRVTGFLTTLRSIVLLPAARIFSLCRSCTVHAKQTGSGRAFCQAESGAPNHRRQRDGCSSTSWKKEEYRVRSSIERNPSIPS